jgi:hypothetical protein
MWICCSQYLEPSDGLWSERDLTSWNVYGETLCAFNVENKIIYIIISGLLLVKTCAHKRSEIVPGVCLE